MGFRETQGDLSTSGKYECNTLLRAVVPNLPGLMLDDLTIGGGANVIIIEVEK